MTKPCVLRVLKILSCTYNIRKYMCKYCKDICSSSWCLSEIHYYPSQKIEENACTLLPTVFDGMGKWNSNVIYIFRFRMTLKNRFEFCFLFFVFAELWKTDLNFVFLFSFSLNFEKRIWISFFVFHFRITLKNGFEFRFSCFVFA